MNRNNGLETVGIVAIVGGFIGLLVISPVLTFGFAYLGGMILNLFVGDAITHGLNVVFDTTRFTTNLIPLTCATLATIGKYFKSSNTNSNKE